MLPLNFSENPNFKVKGWRVVSEGRGLTGKSLKSRDEGCVREGGFRERKEAKQKGLE